SLRRLTMRSLLNKLRLRLRALLDARELSDRLIDAEHKLAHARFQREAWFKAFKQAVRERDYCKQRALQFEEEARRLRAEVNQLRRHPNVYRLHRNRNV